MTCRIDFRWADRRVKAHERTHYNPRVQVHSSAPTRLDLAGGTLDIWPLFLFHDGAQTVNAAITLRASCTLVDSGDGAWHVRSEDTASEFTATSLERTAPPAHRLTLRLLQFFRPDPISVVTRSASPVGAGLAGSSALNIALCGALAHYTGARLDPESLMTTAMNLEAQIIRVPTGAQDYRPALYGGVAAIEMGPGGIVRTPLSIDSGELGERIVLAYTGQSRDSGINNWEVTKRHIDGDAEVIALFDEITVVANAMRSAVERQDWEDIAHQLEREWDLRKRLAPGVTTPSIDTLVDCGIRAGADAAKVCGAGGGGCVLFLADPERTEDVRQALETAGATILDADIDDEGLQVSEG